MYAGRVVCCCPDESRWVCRRDRHTDRRQRWPDRYVMISAINAASVKIQYTVVQNTDATIILPVTLSNAYWFSHPGFRVYSPTAYTGLCRSLLATTFLRRRHKLITSFRKPKVVTTNFKATRPQILSPLVTTGLLGVNRHFQAKFA